jgi:nucleoside-diphosphate-sugar epimerase
VRIAVTGATGFVGRRVLRLLAAEGHRARALVRAARTHSSVPPGVELCPVSEWTPSVLAARLKDIDCIVHAASVVHRPNAKLEEYIEFNVKGTKALVDAGHAVGVKRLVFVSSIKVYGEAPEGTINEALLPDPILPYAVSKLQAEDVVSSARFSHGTACLRLAPVYGVGDKGNVRAMIERIAKNQLFIPGSGETKKSLVHIDLVARSLHALCTNNIEGVFVCANRKTASIGELADLIAELLGKPRPRRLPLRVLEPAGRAVDLIARLLPTQFRASDLIKKAQIASLCDSSRLAKATGLDLDVNLGETLREEIDWLRQSGSI